MNENKNTEHLSEYEISLVVNAMQSNELDDLDVKIRSHLESCTPCKIQVMELSELLVAMDDAGISEDPQIKMPGNSEKKANNWKIWAMAASIALLIVSSIFYWQDRSAYETQIAHLEEDLAQKDRQLVVQKNDSLSAVITKMKSEHQHQIETYLDSISQVEKVLEKNNALLASLYAPNSLLEEEMNLNLRSNSFEVSSPERKEYSANEKIQFAWKDATISEPGLILYNNKGLAVLQVQQIKNGHELLTEKLTPGVYYWQLFQENEMVKMDKFDLR